MTSSGTVSRWSDDEGWGVIASSDTPGGCWAHFSVLDLRGHHSLDPGEIVDFEWEEIEQDGYAYRAVQVRPRRALTGARATTTDTTTDTTTNVYRSTLMITPDEAN
jgi:CspA family cold shock protein